MPPDPSLVGRAGALHGVHSPPSSSSPSLTQQPLEAQHTRSSQSLHARGRSSSAPPALHQRGRTRGRDDTRAARARSHSPAARPPAESERTTPPPVPRSEQAHLDDMQSRQQKLMEQQFAMQIGMEERQAMMLQVKTSADMTKLFADTVSEVTNGFLDSAKKVMEKGGEAMKLR